MTHPITAVYRTVLNAALSLFATMLKLAILALCISLLCSVSNTAFADERVQEQVFLPLIINPPAPPPVNHPLVIENHSFEEGWMDLPPAPGYLINQQPNGWELTWVEPGQPIYGSSYVAHGVPECVHKLVAQLPPHEQPGGSDPLILDGTSTFKIFHYGAAFGAELKQTVTGLIPGQAYRIKVPLRVHGVDSDPWGAESGLWIDGVGSWVNQSIMGDRNWYFHTLEFIALPSGEAEVTIRVKSKYNLSKDFFIDNVQIDAVNP